MSDEERDVDVESDASSQSSDEEPPMWGKRPPSRKPPWFSHRQLCRKPAAALLPSGQRRGPGRKPTPSKLGGRQYFKAVTTKMEEIQLKQKAHHMAIADLDEADYQWADKRAHHNALERRRRDHIKFSFTSLRDAVPSLQGEKRTCSHLPRHQLPQLLCCKAVFSKDVFNLKAQSTGTTGVLPAFGH
ncbi:uncharacterized protein LOC144132745 isoform X2 [Amblyomma americanum]